MLIVVLCTPGAWLGRWMWFQEMKGLCNTENCGVVLAGMANGFLRTANVGIILTRVQAFPGLGLSHFLEPVLVSTVFQLRWMSFNNTENRDNIDEVSGGDERKEKGSVQVSEAGPAAEFSQYRWMMGGDGGGDSVAAVVVVVKVEMLLLVVVVVSAGWLIRWYCLCFNK